MLAPLAAAAALFTLFSLSGCALSDESASDGEVTQNSCTESSACGDGVCTSGICQAQETDLQNLLLEITPPSGVNEIAGVRFTSRVEGLSAGEPLDVQLKHVSRLRGTVTGADVPSEWCTASEASLTPPKTEDGSLPVRVTAIPRERLLGLSAPSYTREILPGEDLSYQLAINVPAGSYDIYVEPLGMPGECVHPPYLIVDQIVEEGDITLNLSLPPPERLDVTVSFPGMIDALNNWSLDVIDRDTGRLLSNQVTLKSPTAKQATTTLEYTATLIFSPVEGDVTVPATELVRLSPPKDITAPVVYFERSVVELFQDGRGTIDQLTELSRPVAYTGRVNRVGSDAPARASVTLIATELKLVDAGTIASFSRTVDTNADGVFLVELLPGTYLVRTEPVDQDLAQTETELTVSSGSDTQAGKVLEVDLRPQLSGQALSFDGASLVGASVQASAPPRAGSYNVVDLARGALPFPPRAVPASTDGSGAYSFLADPGKYDLVFRPEALTGLPWGLKLGVVVPEGSVDLAPIQLSLPVRFAGALTSRDVGTVPGALIRAYAYLKNGEITAEADSATSVIAVGEARVDGSGHFELLLPSHLDQ